MSIPGFDRTKNLPPGIHMATLQELESTFAYNNTRKELFNKLLQFIENIKKTGCTAIYIDGSYVTKKVLPKDIDLCWENQNLNMALVQRQMPLLWNIPLLKVFYGMDIFPARTIESKSNLYFIDFFQKDKITDAPKGIIKIEI